MFYINRVKSIKAESGGITEVGLSWVKLSLECNTGEQIKMTLLLEKELGDTAAARLAQAINTALAPPELPSEPCYLVHTRDGVQEFTSYLEAKEFTNRYQLWYIWAKDDVAEVNELNGMPWGTEVTPYEGRTPIAHGDTIGDSE